MIVPKIVPKQPLPPRLYKYQPFNSQTLTNLKRGWIWFSAPSNVNDPYDCAAWVAQTDEISETDLQKLLTFFHQRDPALMAGWTPDELGKFFINSARKAYDEHRTIQREQRGIACFSATVTDIMMWSHYAHGHRGFCLEFDTSQLPFSEALDVSYVDKPPVINPVDVLIQEPSEDESHELLRAFVLTKARCWSYEQEWRLRHKEPSKRYGYSDPEGNTPLAGIYFGAEMDPAHKDIIGRVTLGEGIQLHEMRREPRSFTLRSEAVTYTLPTVGGGPRARKE